jgi:hypothetical protein
MRRRLHACHMRRRIHAAISSSMSYEEEVACMSYEEEDTCGNIILHAVVGLCPLFQRARHCVYTDFSQLWALHLLSFVN